MRETDRAVLAAYGLAPDSVTFRRASRRNMGSRSLGGGMDVTLAFTPAAEGKYEGQLVLSGNALKPTGRVGKVNGSS